MEDLKKIREYAWSKAILEALMTSIDRSNLDITKVLGYSLALQVT